MICLAGVTGAQGKHAFPRLGARQFIPCDRIESAIARELVEDPTSALVMGVDIARQVEDQTVIRFRRGFDAAPSPP